MDAGGGEIVYVYVTIASHETPFVFLITETSETNIGPGTAFAAHHVLSRSVSLELGLGCQRGTGGGMSLDPLVGGVMPAAECSATLGCPWALPAVLPGRDHPASGQMYDLESSQGHALPKEGITKR